jgi:hypothetical protein
MKTKQVASLRVRLSEVRLSPRHLVLVSTRSCNRNWTNDSTSLLLDRNLSLGNDHLLIRPSCQNCIPREMQIPSLSLGKLGSLNRERLRSGLASLLPSLLTELPFKLQEDSTHPSKSQSMSPQETPTQAQGTMK